MVNTDDTGWSIGGAAAFLMGFFTPLPAVFQIRWRHRHQEVVEMLGTCFLGLLATACGTSYEAGALDSIGQRKCLSHPLKNLSTVEEIKTGRARIFTKELKATLREAIRLWRNHRAGDGSSGKSPTASCVTGGSGTLTTSGSQRHRAPA